MGGHEPRAGAGAAPVAPTLRAGHAGRLWLGCGRAPAGRRCRAATPGPAPLRFEPPPGSGPAPGPGSVCGGGSRGGPSPAGARGPEGSAASGRTGGPRSPPGAGLWNGRDVRPWGPPGKPGEPVRVSLRTDVHSQGGRQREKQLRPARPAAGPALRSFPGSTGRNCEVLGAQGRAGRAGDPATVRGLSPCRGPHAGREGCEDRAESRVRHPQKPVTESDGVASRVQLQAAVDGTAGRWTRAAGLPGL